MAKFEMLYIRSFGHKLPLGTVREVLDKDGYRPMVVTEVDQFGFVAVVLPVGPLLRAWFGAWRKNLWHRVRSAFKSKGEDNGG